MGYNNRNEFPVDGGLIKRIIKGFVGIIAALVVVWVCSGIWETVDAKDIVVCQFPVSGKLEVWTEPGLHMQWWGNLTRYKKSTQYWFSSKADEKTGDTDDSITVRFNDGGHANLSGSMRFDLPTSKEDMMKLHVNYGSQEAIVRNLIRPVVNKAVYMTGPIMSSAESYASRRNDLINYISDQMAHGVFKTDVNDEKVKDPVTGQEKTVSKVTLRKGNGLGGIERQEKSPLEEFGIRIDNPSITNVQYDEQVEAQIKQQQQAKMAVETALANAKKAEQDALTTAKQGEAAAAKTKWEQEAINAKEIALANKDKQVAVTAAEKQRDVAKLAKESAEFKKQEQILLGEGEAARAAAVMHANGALEMKLEAYKFVNKNYAEALAGAKLVPDVQMGGSGGSQALNLVDLLTAKTARDLGLDFKEAAAARKAK